MKTALGYVGAAVGVVGLAVATVIAAPFVGIAMLLMRGVEPLPVTHDDL